MNQAKLIPSRYATLVADITLLYTNARQALVEAYWKIGRRIVEVEQDGRIKAPRGTSLLEKLSEDLSRQLDSGFSTENLRRMRRFYLDYPKQSAPTDMTWTQYVELLPVENEARRKQLIQKAIRGHLPHKELRRLVQQELVREKVAQNLGNSRDKETVPLPLTPRLGALYTYRILDPKTVQPKEPGLLLVDLGFSCYRDLDAITSKTLKPEDFVASVKTSDDHYTLKPFSSPDSKLRPQDSLYTYKATVEKIVDGDTLRVVVDLGFNTRTRQYLRLRGIDCPERDTEEGKRAADFVRSRIRAADEILLTSSQSDKYDRYLADVFFEDQNGEEHYLNNLLLESSLAVRTKN